MSNDLIDLMREFGVEVRLLGTDEEPNPCEAKIADMLTEIHTLRTRIASERQAGAVSDEGLREVFIRSQDHAFHEECVTIGESIDAGIRAVRAALAPVPQIPEGWILNSIDTAEGGQYACLLSTQIAEDDFIEVEGVGPTWLDALNNAIAAAKEAGE